MKQRVLVHGAESFVGARLCAELAASDWAQPFFVATGDATTLTRELGEAQGVVQCLLGSPAAIQHGATALYGALAASKSRPRVVHLSSMTVYGSATGVVAEDNDLLADLGPYSRAQYEAERMALSYDNAVILRPGSEYGPGCPHWSLRIARLLLARRLGDLGRWGDGWCNLLYIDDLASATVQALRIPGIAGERFNLAVPAPPTWNEYLVAFARALQAVPVRRIGPRQLRMETRLLAPVLKVAELARLRMPPPITPSLLALCRQDIQLDVSRAERMLGLRWTDTRTGLEKASAWCRSSLGLAP